MLFTDTVQITMVDLRVRPTPALQLKVHVLAGRASLNILQHLAPQLFLGLLVTADR